MKITDLREWFENETGKCVEAPTTKDEPRHFNPAYVDWLERRFVQLWARNKSQGRENE